MINSHQRSRQLTEPLAVYQQIWWQFCRCVWMTVVHVRFLNHNGCFAMWRQRGVRKKCEIKECIVKNK